MPTFAVYNEGTGEIVRVYFGPTRFASLQAGVGEAVLLADAPIDDLAHYVDLRGAEPSIEARRGSSASANKASIAADGVEVVTIADIPAAAVVSIHGPGVREVLERSHVAGEDVEISVDVSGRYTVLIQSFPDQQVRLAFEGLA